MSNNKSQDEEKTLAEAKRIISMMAETISNLQSKLGIEMNVKNNLYAFLIKQALMEEFYQFLGDNPSYSPTVLKRAVQEFTASIKDKEEG